MKKYKIGIQLYSLRDEMEKDMDATLKSVAEMGYDCVEFAGYFGHTAQEVKAMCEKYGLEPISVHQKHHIFLEDAKNAVDYLKTLGIKYCAIPWLSEWETNYDKNIDEIEQVGKLLKANGIQLLYHNHDFELTQKHGDKTVLDSIYSQINSDLLCPELDLCWVHYAGCDPVEYIKKYGNIEEIIHLKDFECKNLNSGPVYGLIDGSGKDNKRDQQSDGFEFRPIGHGRQDVKALFAAMENTKIKYVIVEQDGHPTNNSLEDARISIDYIRSIGY